MANIVKYKKGCSMFTVGEVVWNTRFRPPYTIQHKEITLYTDGRLVIGDGYPCDGVTFPLGNKIKWILRGAVVHDALSQLMRNGYLNSLEWPLADKEMYLVCIDAGCWEWFAKSVLKTLSIAKGFYTRPENKRKVYIAP